LLLNYTNLVDSSQIKLKSGIIFISDQEGSRIHCSQSCAFGSQFKYCTT